MNSSKYRVPSPLRVGDQVYVRNIRTSKFQPLFGPAVFTILEIAHGGAVVRNNDDNTTYTRHVDDLKLAPPPSHSANIVWFPPSENDKLVAQAPEEPAHHPPPVPTEVPLAIRRPERTRQPPRRLIEEM